MIELTLQRNLPRQNFVKYKVFSPKLYSQALVISKQLGRKTIIHINATPSGGGVAELLKSQIPIERSLGQRSSWLTLRAPKYFFDITKKIHNLLQGRAGPLDESEKKYYLNINYKLGASLAKFLKRHSGGIVVIHDPQALPLIRFIPKRFKPILRLHIDLLTPNPTVLEFFRPYIQEYSSVIISNPDYSPALSWLKKSQLKIIPPAIDPLSEKNKPINYESARRIIETFTIHCDEPIISQISRFDQWKNPLGVIRAYYLAKNKISNLQLILAGFFFAQDDPEAISVFKKVKKHAEGDPDIFLFSNPKRLGVVSNDTFINALQTVSTVILQKSIREGFGLTVTEAMWKGKVVIAGNASGPRLQIKNRKNGFIVSSPEEAAKIIVHLIKDKKLRDKIGGAARRTVRDRFLILRFILDNFKVYI